tara:strand:- start:29714 stop:30790 length:1077 start_codon:yes stop_codon:yes gene_type:complete
MGGNVDSSVRSSSLLHTLQSNFTVHADGSIRDENGGSWLVWTAADFQHWWLALETHLGVPMGRKLMNAAADEEEWMFNKYSLFRVNGLFKKRKQQALLSQRWHLLGWGKLSLANDTITSNLMAPITAGLALAALEKVHLSRIKLQWKQVSPTQTLLELEPDTRQLAPVRDPRVFEWQNPSQQHINDRISPIELDIEVRELGWANAGEASVLLPVGFFSRIFEAISTQLPLLAPSRIESFHFSESMQDSSTHVVSATCLAIEDLLAKSERPVYIQDIQSWRALCDAYMIPFGLGTYERISATDEHGGVLFQLKSSSHLPLTVAWLIALWQRGHGKKAKSSLVQQGSGWSLEVSSLLNYA